MSAAVGPGPAHRGLDLARKVAGQLSGIHRAYPTSEITIQLPPGEDGQISHIQLLDTARAANAVARRSFPHLRMADGRDAGDETFINIVRAFLAQDERAVKLFGGSEAELGACDPALKIIATCSINYAGGRDKDGPVRFLSDFPGPGVTGPENWQGWWCSSTCGRA